MDELKYKKTCVCCKKEYRSNARGSRFCSEQCRKNYNKRLQDDRKFYVETKALMRLKARAHALAVEIKRYELYTQGKDFVCELCGEPGVEVHHKDLNFLNNTPSNLICLCKKCHAKAHSDAVKNNSPVDTSFFELVKPIYK